MYVHHIEFNVRPDLFDRWEVHAGVSLGTFRRMEGLVLIRLLRDLDDDTRFVSLRVWRSKEDSDRAAASREMAAISDRAQAGRFGEGLPPAAYSEYQLWDQVFGCEGPASYRQRGAYVGHILASAPGPEQPMWPAYVRNFAAVIARQKGCAAYEIARDLHNPNRHLVLRTWLDRESARVSPEESPNAEVRLALEPVADHDFYRGLGPAEYRHMEVVDAAHGPSGVEDIDAFHRSLRPV